MAKPINPYQGPAPAAMSRMGEGIMEAGANIGRSLQSGYEALGKGIGSGITALAGAYSDYKKMESGVKGAEKSYEMFRPYLDPELRTQFDNQIASINSDKALSLQDKAAFWDQAKGFIGGAINQKGREEIAKIQAGAKTGRPSAPMSPFSIGSVDDLFNTPVSPVKAQPVSLDLPANSSAASPDSLFPGAYANPQTRKNMITGQMEFFDPRNKRWIQEPEQQDSELYFNPLTRAIVP